MSRSRESAAWAFLVVSDPGQADTLADQEAWAQEAAHANQWVITKTVSGVSSGKLGARRLTLGMIDELEALQASERPARLLMIRLERLGRGNGLEAMEAFLRIRRLGIVVHTRIDGDVEYSRASELLMPVLRFFIGGMENEVRRDKLNSMYERRRIAQKDDPTLAISTKMPYGLRLENGHFAPKPPEDAAVQLAFELKTQGYGPHKIAKQLALIAPPMTLKDGSAHPQHWTTDRVRRLLLKTCYRGTIVDAAIWTRAQRRLREFQRPTMRYEYPLGGALRCECGYALFGQRGPRGSSTFNYYVCRNVVAHSGRYKHYRGDRLEEQFLSLLARLSVEDDLLRRFLKAQHVDVNLDASRAECASAKGELARIDERRRRIFSAFEKGSLAQADLQWRLDDLRDIQTTLERRILAIERDITHVQSSRRSIADAQALVTSAKGHWENAGVDDRRALAKAIGNAFGGLVVTSDGALVVGRSVVQPTRSPRLLQHNRDEAQGTREAGAVRRRCSSL